MTYKVDVNFETCDVYGRCVDIAPGIFDISDDDELIVMNETPGEDQRSTVEEAARRCPKLAIKVVDA